MPPSCSLAPSLVWKGMMAQRESRLSRDIMKKLRAEGAFCFKVWGSEYMMAGLPDIIGCHRGRFFAFETKTPDKRDNVSVVQQLVHGKIKAAGGMCEVICSAAEAIHFISLLSR